MKAKLQMKLIVVFFPLPLTELNIAHEEPRNDVQSIVADVPDVEMEAGMITCSIYLFFFF